MCIYSTTLTATLCCKWQSHKLVNIVSVAQSNGCIVQMIVGPSSKLFCENHIYFNDLQTKCKAFTNS